MKIKVIEVNKDGKIGYLAHPTVFSGNGKPVRDSPLEAMNYNLPENALSLDSALKVLQVKDGAGGAMSGVSVTSAHVVEIEITMKEVSRQKGREATQ